MHLDKLFGGKGQRVIELLQIGRLLTGNFEGIVTIRLQAVAE